MRGYTPERRKAILAKLSGPGRRSIAEVATEEGVSAATLYAWRNQARQKGQLLPDADQGPEGWSSSDKFAAVLACASLSEAEIGEYCRRNGLYPEQVRRWRQACECANDWERSRNESLARAAKEAKESEARLRSELRRKEKALAEAAALLVLQKKVRAIWGEEEG